MAKLAIPTREVAFYNRHGQRIWQDGRGLDAGYPFAQYSVHRGEMHLMLTGSLRTAGRRRVITGQRLERFEQDDDAVRATFSARDGTQSTAPPTCCWPPAASIQRAPTVLSGRRAARWSRLILYRGVTRSAVPVGPHDGADGQQGAEIVCYPIRGRPSTRVRR
jgi:hypothetical protein